MSSSLFVMGTGFGIWILDHFIEDITSYKTLSQFWDSLKSWLPTADYWNKPLIAIIYMMLAWLSIFTFNHAGDLLTLVDQLNPTTLWSWLATIAAFVQVGTWDVLSQFITAIWSLDLARIGETRLITELTIFGAMLLSCPGRAWTLAHSVLTEWILPHLPTWMHWLPGDTSTVIAAKVATGVLVSLLVILIRAHL